MDVSKKLMPQLEGPADERPALLLVERPGMGPSLGYAVAHAAQAEARNFEAGLAEVYVLHLLLTATDVAVLWNFFHVLAIVAITEVLVDGMVDFFRQEMHRAVGGKGTEPRPDAGT